MTTTELQTELQTIQPISLVIRGDTIILIDQEGGQSTDTVSGLSREVFAGLSASISALAERRAKAAEKAALAELAEKLGKAIDSVGHNATSEEVAAMRSLLAKAEIHVGEEVGKDATPQSVLDARAEEARVAEEARLAAEAQAAEDARIAAEAQAVEDARVAVEAAEKPADA